MYGKTKNKTLKKIIVSRYIDDKKVILKTFEKKLKSWRAIYNFGKEWALQQGYRIFLMELSHKKEDRPRFNICCAFTEEEYRRECRYHKIKPNLKS